MSVSASLSDVADAPDRLRSVVADHQCAVVRDGDADRTSPDLAIGGHETGDEILVFAGGLSVLDGHANDLISGARFAVPGAVLGGENLALVFLGKLLAFVERHSERSVVRLQEHVGHDHFTLELGMLAGETRILMAANVIPGPA